MKTIKQVTIKTKRIRLSEPEARYHTTKTNSPDLAARALRAVIDVDIDQEQFGALYLDTQNRILGACPLFTGGHNMCHVEPAIVYRPAILLGAVSVVVGHNHPSGNTAPSDEDIELTERLQKIADLLGVVLLDHIILTQDSHLSMRESGGLK